MAGSASKKNDSNFDFLLSLGETLKRQVAAPNINGYQPHAKQIDFHSSNAKTRLYIGGNRSGKSTGSIAECVYWLRKDHPYKRLPIGDYEGCRGRLNCVDFINGANKIVLPLLKQFVPPSLLINGAWEDSYHKTEHVLSLSNGSMLEILSYESELDKFAGTSRHFIAYDEEPPQVIYTENRARLIDTGGHQWFAMTPVEGLSFVYDLIYLPGKAGDPNIHITEIEMSENPYINPEEVKEFLNGLEDDDEREARGKGKFIEIGGRIYKKFDAAVGGLHVINESITRFPKEVPIAMSLDHGFNNPTAVLWHAILPEGRIITFYEHYLSGEIVRFHAQRIHEINRKFNLKPTIRIADPSIKNTDPLTGTSIQQEYLKYGIPWTLANNDVRAGIERVNSYLDIRRAGSQPLWKCTKDCPNLIKEMGRYKWKTYTSKKLNAQYNKWDTPHKLNDHACDSLRYFLMSQPGLESVFDNANYHAPRTESYPDAVRNMGGDFTVHQLRESELRNIRNPEYVQTDGNDLMGGIW